MCGLILAVNGFDLFVVFYLCNEITVASEELLYCVFESNWFGQSKMVALNLAILTEVLKRPQQLVVSKLFPMNLMTFTSVISIGLKLNEKFYGCFLFYRLRNSRTVCSTF